MIALKLAKEGYYQGDPEKILAARLDFVLEAAEYENFLSDYYDACDANNE